MFDLLLGCRAQERDPDIGGSLRVVGMFQKNNRYVGWRVFYLGYTHKPGVR
jgi:hypothetical protein